jgi:hypothetical protein
MGLSIRGYARHRRVTHQAVRKAIAAGRIVVGADGTIDPAVADRTWQNRTAARMPPPTAPPEPAPGGLGSEPGGGASPGFGMGSAGGSDASTYHRARAAALVVDVQTKRLVLEQRRGALISRDRAVMKAFSFARMLRDRWLSWPARVGPQLAAQFEVDAGAVTVVLEGYVREHLAELASESVEF